MKFIEELDSMCHDIITLYCDVKRTTILLSSQAMAFFKEYDDYSFRLVEPQSSISQSNAFYISLDIWVLESKSSKGPLTLKELHIYIELCQDLSQMIPLSVVDFFYESLGMIV